MRIKSYFAPSVQAAIALARKEFGDGVTLVTSHVASLDNRHLGEYEVVFAVEESIEESSDVPEGKAEQPAPAPVPVFSELLQQAITAPLPMQQNLPEKLEQIHDSRVALGLESSLVRSFMTMLKAVVPASSVPVETAIISVPAEPPVIQCQQSRWEESQFEEPQLPEPPAQVASPPIPPEISKPAPRPFLSLFESPRPQPRFSDAELAFISSVSAPKEQGA